MSRLIDADLLMEKLNVFNDRVHGNEHFLYGIETAKELLEDMPTTTETEIRTMAISDFLQFVYDNASNEEYANEDGWAMSDLIDLEYKFLEQLKEE